MAKKDKVIFGFFLVLSEEFLFRLGAMFTLRPAKKLASLLLTALASGSFCLEFPRGSDVLRV